MNVVGPDSKKIGGRIGEVVSSADLDTAFAGSVR